MPQIQATSIRADQLIQGDIINYGDDLLIHSAQHNNKGVVLEVLPLGFDNYGECHQITLSPNHKVKLGGYQFVNKPDPVNKNEEAVKVVQHFYSDIAPGYPDNPVIHKVTNFVNRIEIQWGFTQIPFATVAVSPQVWNEVINGCEVAA